MKKETALYTALGVIALVLVGWGLSRSSQVSPVETSPSVSVSPGASVSTSATPRPTVTQPAPTMTAVPATYNEDVVTYVGRRIQFDQYCQANPPRLALRNGLSVMIDNRSGDARTFSVGGTFFTLPGYGWKIVTPTASSLPADVSIDCGSSRNVGTIVLQP